MCECERGGCGGREGRRREERELLDNVQMSYCDSPAVPPSPPTITVAMATSSTSIRVQWVASVNDGGSPLTGYIIEYRVSGGEFSGVAVVSDVVATTIDGLTPFGLYEVRVVGENMVGRGEPSNSLVEQTHPAGEGRGGEDGKEKERGRKERGEGARG